MRVAVVGAGALGSVYGGRLALLGGCEVTVVAKTAAAGLRTRLERADGAAEAPLDWIRAEDRTGPVPSDADVILVCVRYEQLDSVVAAAGDGRAPLVFLTPMLPQDHARLSSALPGRVVAAMPSVIAYRRQDGTVRYWQPRSATTWVEARAAGGGAEVELTRRLERAGLRAKLDPDTLVRNAATTVSFMPMVIGLDVAGGIERALADDKLTSLALRATEEGRALGRSLGKPEPWASTILSFARPFLLKVGVGIARSRAPETLAYVDHHFVQKLHAQNVAMGARIIELAKSRDAKSDALERLVARLATKA